MSSYKQHEKSRRKFEKSEGLRRRLDKFRVFHAASQVAESCRKNGCDFARLRLQEEWAPQ